MNRIFNFSNIFFESRTDLMNRTQGLSGVVDSTLAFHADDPGSIPGSGSKGVALCHSLEWRASFGWDVKPRSSLCTHAKRSSTDLKEPGWPSESLGVQRHTDNTHLGLKSTLISHACCAPWLVYIKFWGKNVLSNYRENVFRGFDSVVRDR